MQQSIAKSVNGAVLLSLGLSAPVPSLPRWKVASHFELRASDDGTLEIYWGCQAPAPREPCMGRLIWAGPVSAAKELSRMIDVISWHGERSPNLMFRLSVERG